MTVQFSVRVPDETHAKMRIMSAFRKVPVNTLVVDALKDSISNWENKYGELPLPPKEFQ